jgi:uncharacterized NAD-dependent epimerase/dehydratase family protein
LDANITGTAFLLTNGAFNQVEAKTSHGLIRGSSRFKVKAVIDHLHAGNDAGMLLDGIYRGIPVYSTLEEAVRENGKPDFCIIGMATVGGILPGSFEHLIEQVLKEGISVVNGLHDYLNDRPSLVELAGRHNARLIDVRKPKPFKDLKFWSPEIYSVECPIIALLGMDCAVGKRTTAYLLVEACKQAGLKAEMIYTGQTGWMQGFNHGFILDATLNDFVGGELAHAILQAYRTEHPDLIFLEGQSSMRNPSGPCGPEFLLSGNAGYVILVHEIGREYYDENPVWGLIPTVNEEIELIERYGARVIALALNTRGCIPDEISKARMCYENELGIPVILPLEEGVGSLTPSLIKLLNNEDPANQVL